jgi:hypothetical protein
MATIKPLDLVLYRGLSRLRFAYTGLLSVSTRQLEELTPAEVELDGQWQTALEPVLSDLYWWPLRNGLDDAPTNERELRRWLKQKYANEDGNNAVIAALLALLLLYQRRGVNIGGRVGLDLIGVGGSFNLTNAGYLNALEDHAASLTRQGTEFSLIDTTIEHLVTGIPAARAAATNTLLTLGTMIAGWVTVRSVLIAVTERSWGFARGLNWTYRENGIQMQIFNTRGHGCPKICTPLDGTRMPVNNIPPELWIPKHSGCDCVYTAVLDDWEQPATIWRGE